MHIRVKTRFAATLTLCLALSLALCVSEAGERLIGLSAVSSTADRMRLARNIFFHDFENRSDLDSGTPLASSADLDNDGWPDFWEPVRAVDFPEYLINTIAIVPDPSPFVSGAYRDVENHVLHIGFDGTQVGIRTRVPVAIDPSLAYEFSLRSRDQNLWGVKIRAGIEWIRTDDLVTDSLRRDEIANFFPGQVDWPVSPRRLLVSNPPLEANAARLFIILERDPEAIHVARHGDIWFDDILLRTLPKVIMRPAEQPSGAAGDPQIDVEYSGLIDNVPDPENPGFFRGKRYSRQMTITDVHNRPIGSFRGERTSLAVGSDESLSERIAIPSDRYGVYYINLRIYDADDLLAADMTQAIALMRPSRKRDRLDVGVGKPSFGLVAGAPPQDILAASGFLQHILDESGARHVKITPWLDTYDAGRDGNAYYTLLGEEIRRLRPSGTRVIGVVDPPFAMFDNKDLAEVMMEKPENLEPILVAAGQNLGLFMDGWQWGRDSDDSLAKTMPAEAIEQFSAVMGDFAGGMPMVWNERLGAAGYAGQSPALFGTINGFTPAYERKEWIWPSAAPLFPWLFSPFYIARGATYPPPELNRLAPPPPADSIEANAAAARQRAVWLSIDPVAVPGNEPDAAEERSQLEHLLLRAVYGAILAPDVIFLGDLFDSAKGVLRQASPQHKPILATMARPAYLGASVASEFLTGAEYLGRIDLLPPFEAHAFRRAGSDAAIIALWHNGPEGVRNLDRVEIADGPPLTMTDWVGNVEALPQRIPVQRIPMFISGMSAPMALTRMSVRISPEPPVKASDRRQNQILEVVNHFASQVPLLFRLRYAARLPDGGMENGWTVTPQEMRANLAPRSPTFASTKLPFSVSPDPNSPLQKAGPAEVDKAATKLAQVRMTINATPPADILMYLRYALRSDIDVDVVRLERSDDPYFVTLQLRIRWFPTGNDRRRGEIRLTPFYMRKGEMKETGAMPVTVRASRENERANPDARYETVELRIPRNPLKQTWIGLTEDGGSNFYLADITDFLE